MQRDFRVISIPLGKECSAAHYCLHLTEAMEVFCEKAVKARREPLRYLCIEMFWKGRWSCICSELPEAVRQLVKL